MPSNRTGRRGRPVMAAALGAALLGAAVHADTETRSFDVSPGDRLVLDTEWGEVHVATHDGDTVELVVEQAEAIDLACEQQDGTLTIRGTRKDGGVVRWFLDWGDRPTFRLTVPHRHDLSLRAAGGDIAVDDLDGELSARTSGGSVAIEEVTGSLEVETSGGAIRAASAGGAVTATTSGGAIALGPAAGDVDARTSGGSIRIEEAAGRVAARTSGGSIAVSAAGPIEARTSGGSIRATFRQQPDGDSDLRTSGGDIEVLLPPGVAVDIDAKTSGGRVVADVPVTVEGTLERAALRGAIGGGGPQLRLRTSGGSIVLEPL